MFNTDNLHGYWFYTVFTEFNLNFSDYFTKKFLIF